MPFDWRSIFDFFNYESTHSHSMSKHSNVLEGLEDSTNNKYGKIGNSGNIDKAREPDTDLRSTAVSMVEDWYSGTCRCDYNPKLCGSCRLDAFEPIEWETRSKRIWLEAWTWSSYVLEHRNPGLCGQPPVIAGAITGRSAAATEKRSVPTDYADISDRLASVADAFSNDFANAPDSDDIANIPDSDGIAYVLDSNDVRDVSDDDTESIAPQITSDFFTRTMEQLTAGNNATGGLTIETTTSSSAESDDIRSSAIRLVADWRNHKCRCADTPDSCGPCGLGAWKPYEWQTKKERIWQEAYDSATQAHDDDTSGDHGKPPSYMELASFS